MVFLKMRCNNVNFTFYIDIHFETTLKKISWKKQWRCRWDQSVYLRSCNMCQLVDCKWRM